MAQYTADDLAPLDPVKLSGAHLAERGEIFLLQYLSNCEAALKVLPEDVIRSAQPALEQALYKLLVVPATATAPGPKPGRPIRSIISRCLIQLYTAGDSKSLFDGVQTLSRAMADPKLEKEQKVAAFSCAGEIMQSLGSQILSMVTDLVNTCLRTARLTSAPIIVRHAALLCIWKTISSGGKAVNETLAKDLLKGLKSFLTDKTACLQRAAADALLIFYQSGVSALSTQEIDSTTALVLKAMDSADFQTRRSLSRLMSGLLAISQVPGSAPVIEVKPKKAAAKKEGENDDDPYPTGSTAAVSDSTKTLLTLREMLHVLSVPYSKAQTTRRAKVGIIDIYATLLATLGHHYIESNYTEILKHIIDELAGSRPGLSRFEALTARTAASLLLRKVIGVRLLSEQGQIVALREIAGAYLHKWPALLPGSTGPSKNVLVVALDEVSGLLQQLDSAPPSAQEVVYDAVFRLLEHPSFSVQVAAAQALKSFCSAVPTRLSSTISLMLELLNKNLGQLGQGSSGSEVNKHAVGHAYALAALISVIPSKPLYVSYDVSAKVMSLAIQLLKQSGNHDLHISAVEIQVAWVLVASLMSLGHHFVRLHLPQLLILWKNALPKPTSKDASASQIRSDKEWGFLLHIRECTLSAVLGFLRHNAQLVNVDVGRRIGALLSNALVFSGTFTTQHANLQPEQSSSSTLLLIDRDLMLRRRLFQCFLVLGQTSFTDSIQSTLLTAALSTFADPEKYTGSSVQAAIAASSGASVSVWESTDGFGYGVTSLVRESETLVADQGSGRSVFLNRDSVESEIAELLKQPTFGALENDPLYLCDPTCASEAKPCPAATGVVDSAIEVFALYFSSQDFQLQTKLMAQMVECAQSPKTERNLARRMAILINSSAALLGSLRLAMSAQSRKGGENMAVPQINKPVQDIIKVAMLHQDARLRAVGSEAMGRLCQVAGASFMSSQVQSCISQVVSNTDPSARAGCALTLGEIYGHVGSLSAGPVLKTMIDVLMSLSSDPHPLVQFWALQALSRVIDAASLSYSSYINGTLGVVARLYVADSHEPEGGSAASVNMRGDLPTYQAFCRILDAVIGVLGPDLQEQDSVQTLILTLVHEFRQESEEGVAVEGMRAMQHFLMFEPKAMELSELVKTLRARLSSHRRPLKVAAINSVYQLVQHDALAMSKIGGDQLVAELFALLDDDPSIEGVRDAITSWLKQTATMNPSGWIDLCQRIMARTTAAGAAQQTNEQGTGGFTDEESQGLGVDSGDSGGRANANSRGTSRWRTQLFALECLHEVFLTLLKSGKREHFNASLSQGSKATRKRLLIGRVSDLVRMAFTASAAPVMPIRLQGLVLLRDVIENFSKSRDLDFEDALLLEQHQAAIAAALTPAFAADSFPEVLASAIQVCAVFIGCGVIRDISKMGRILRLLTGALENCKDVDMTSLGEVKDLSSTASIMLKTSIFSAWGELATASFRQDYLRAIVKPYYPILCPFWLASLREFARIRVDPEASATSSSATSSTLESSYAGLNREVALPYYERSWRPMLHAIALLMKAREPLAIAAFSGQDTSDAEKPNPSPATEEPALFFYVIFGLAFEVLADPSSFNTHDEDKSRSAQTASIALEAMEGLLLPASAGPALTRDGLYEELCGLFYRLTITESLAVQARVIQVVSLIAAQYGKDFLASDALLTNGSSQPKSFGEAKLSQCIRVIVGVLANAIGSVARISASELQSFTVLLDVSWTALLDVADQYPPKYKEDLYATAVTLYARLLQSELLDSAIIQSTLPTLKRLCERSSSLPNDGQSDLVPRVLQALLATSLQNIDDVRDREGKTATVKSGNNLLAAALIITNLPKSTRISQSNADHCCTLIGEAMASPEKELALTALHCARSIITSSARGNPLLQYCSGHLLPDLIAFGANVPSTFAQGAQEVVKTLSLFVTALPESHKRDGLSIVLPIFVVFLKPSDPSAPSHAATVPLLLSAASNYPAAFREATQTLEGSQRVLLESSIRQSVGSGTSASAAQSANAQATIDLKMDF